MAVVETRHNIITDKDIKRNHFLSEKKIHSAKVKYTLISHTHKKAHIAGGKDHSTEAAGQMPAHGLSSGHQSRVTNEKSKEDAIRPQELPVKEKIPDKAHSKGRLSQLKDALKLYLPGKDHDKAKDISSVMPSSESVRSGVEQPLVPKEDDKTAEVAAFMQARGHVVEDAKPPGSKVSHGTDYVHIEKMKSRLDEIEHTVHEMNSLLKKDSSGQPSSKSGSGKIRGASDDLAIMSKDSKEVRDLVKKEEKFSGDIIALEQVYKDGILSQESFEEKRRQIEKNISDLQDAILRTLEKEELDELKRRLEDEIRTSLTSGPFSVEQKKYHEDINALAKIYEVGLITEKDHNAKRDDLKAKLNKADNIIERIDAVFEEYRKELMEEISDKEAGIEERTQPQKSVADDLSVIEANGIGTIQDKPVGFVGKIKNIIGISGIHQNISVSDPVIAEMSKIKKADSRRDALIKCSFILKGLTEKKIGIKEELTYNQLIGKLPQSAIDQQLSESLSHFFEKVSFSVYSDSMNPDELPLLLEEVVVLAGKVQKIKGNDEQKVIIPQNPVVKKSSIIEKINSFFGV